MTDISWEVIALASIIVRGLDESVKQRLAARARDRGRSMEAEVREILSEAVRHDHIGLALLAAAQSVGGVDEVVLDDRTELARSVDFE